MFSSEISSVRSEDISLNRNSPPAFLLRESFRKEGKVHKGTIDNLTHWPPVVVAGLRSLFRGWSKVMDHCEDQRCGSIQDIVNRQVELVPVAGNPKPDREVILVVLFRKRILQ